MEILIENQQSLRAISSECLKKTATAILNALDCPDGELSLLIVDDAKIALLNQQYRERSGPTNVLSFPMNEGAFSEIMPHLLGDVVISVETCEREAQSTGTSVDQHFNELLIHGILHLFGYDHERSEEEDRRMRAKSDDLLQHIDQPHPAPPNG
jgi:probable rRNA maturation factor